jgi:hypothetical protein
MALSEIIALVTICLTLAGIVWKFGSITATLGVTLNALGIAIGELKQEIKTIGSHATQLAAHDVRIANLEKTADRQQDRLDDRDHDRQ